MAVLRSEKNKTNLKPNYTHDNITIFFKVSHLYSKILAQKQYGVKYSEGYVEFINKDDLYKKNKGFNLCLMDFPDKWMKSICQK